MLVSHSDWILFQWQPNLVNYYFFQDCEPKPKKRRMNEILDVEEEYVQSASTWNASPPLTPAKSSSLLLSSEDIQSIQNENEAKKVNQTCTVYTGFFFRVERDTHPTILTLALRFLSPKSLNQKGCNNNIDNKRGVILLFQTSLPFKL